MRAYRKPRRLKFGFSNKVVVRCARGSEVLWQSAPLTPCRQDVKNRIEDSADIHMPLAPSVPRGRDERLSVGHVLIAVAREWSQQCPQFSCRAHSPSFGGGPAAVSVYKLKLRTCLSVSQTQGLSAPINRQFWN